MTKCLAMCEREFASFFFFYLKRIIINYQNRYVSTSLAVTVSILFFLLLIYNEKHMEIWTLQHYHLGGSNESAES